MSEDIRYWHKADMTFCAGHIRYWGQSRYGGFHCRCPLITQSGLANLDRHPADRTINFNALGGGERSMVEERVERRLAAIHTPSGSRCRGGSKTTSRCRSSTCTSPSTRRSSARKAAPWNPDPHLGHAPASRGRDRRPLEVQGGAQQRRQGQARRSLLLAPAVQLMRLAAGHEGPAASSWTSVRFDLSARKSSSSPPGGRQRPPEGATPVDFAYAVHTKVGDRTVGARVNGSSFPSQRAPQGDTVEISPPTGRGPSRDWLHT